MKIPMTSSRPWRPGAEILARSTGRETLRHPRRHQPRPQAHVLQRQGRARTGYRPRPADAARPTPPPGSATTGISARSFWTEPPNFGGATRALIIGGLGGALAVGLFPKHDLGVIGPSVAAIGWGILAVTAWRFATLMLAALATPDAGEDTGPLAPALLPARWIARR